MKNPLKNETFNRFDATKDRSPRFRAFVIILLLGVTCFLIYVCAFKKDVNEMGKSILPDHRTTVGK